MNNRFSMFDFVFFFVLFYYLFRFVVIVIIDFMELNFYLLVAIELTVYSTENCNIYSNFFLSLGVESNKNKTGKASNRQHTLSSN